jgi:plasmid maintenance system antidote protein VapI
MQNTSTRLSQIHIGEIIRQQLKEEGRSIVWLSKQINCDSSNLCKLLNQNSFYTDQLYRISVALKTDYFGIFSEVVKKSCENCQKQQNVLMA